MDLFLPMPFVSGASLDLLPDGRPSGAGVVGAVLADHGLRQDASGIALALVPQEGAAAEGLLFRGLEPRDAERISFVMAAFEAQPVPVRVAVDGASLPAIAHVRPVAGRLEAAVDPAARSCEARRLTAEVLREIAGHFGTRRPEEMAGLLHGIGFRAIARVRGARTETPVEMRGYAPGEADIQRLDQRSGYARYFAMEEHRLRHRRFDGSFSEVVDRSVIASGDAVTVLPFDPVRQTVLVIEQFRPGALARNDPNPWLIEPIAGRCDRLEAPEETARREAREEAGLELGRLVELPGFYSSPGMSSEYMTAFVAEADLSAAGGTFGLEEEGEDIRSHVLPLDAALAAVASGEINVAPLILSLLWLQNNRQMLVRDWRTSSAA